MAGLETPDFKAMFEAMIKQSQVNQPQVAPQQELPSNNGLRMQSGGIVYQPIRRIGE